MRLSTSLILVIIVLTMTPIVFAANPLINKEYFTGDYITVANETYLIIGTDSDGGYWNNYSSVIFKHNITKVMFKVGVGECFSTESHTYCFNTTTYDWKKNFTWQGSILEPSMLIKIYSYASEVQLDRPKLVKLEYGNRYTIESKLKNTGSKETNVYYVEQLPAQFIVTNCNLCRINGNTVTAQIGLNDGEEKIISYTIQYFGYANLSWIANYTYSYDDQIRSDKKEMNSTVIIPYEIKESLTRRVSNTLGDISTYTLSIKNRQNYSMIKVNVSINNNVVKDYELLNKQDNTYYYTGIISSRESKNFSIILDSYMVGEFPIYVDARIESNGQVFVYRKNNSFNVSLDPLKPSLIVDKTKAEPNDTIRLVASLKNTDEQAQYIYVYAHLLPHDVQWSFDKINPGKELILYNDTFPIPESDDNLHIILSGIYRTTNLQDQTFTVEKIINVTGRGLKSAINSTAANDSSTPKKNVTVKPKVKHVVNKTTIKNNSSSEEEEQDILKSIIESIDSFIRGIFGKK
jgi:hypothetical protein